MTINRTVGTRYISSALPTRLIFIALVAVLFTFVLRLPILHAQDDPAVLYPGTYQAEDARVSNYKFYAQTQFTEEIQAVDGAQFGRARVVTIPNFSFYGTEVILRWRGGDTLYAHTTCSYIFPQKFSAEGEGWHETYIKTKLIASYSILLLSANPEESQISDEEACMGLAPEKLPPFILDSITVLDRTAENLFPYIAAVAVTLGMTLYVVISALRERWRK